MVTERLSAGFIIVRRAPEGWRYLLLRCFRYWDFAKGELDPGETPLAAAQREVAEETGLSGLELAWGRDYYQTEPYRGGKRARYYLALSREGEVVLGVNPELGQPEHQEYRWLSRSAAAGLLNERVRGALDWAAARVEPRGGNLLRDLACPSSGERFDDLLHCGRVRIERILSSAAPEPVVYEQAQDEWVLLLEGRARLELDGQPRDLGPGDWLFIPARTPHRVLATWPEPNCLWLAVHIHPEPGEGADGWAT
jgi:bis(5'-nucleosidyl)-tetraphosphatase